MPCLRLAARQDAQHLAARPCSAEQTCRNQRQLCPVPTRLERPCWTTAQATARSGRLASRFDWTSATKPGTARLCCPVRSPQKRQLGSIRCRAKLRLPPPQLPVPPTPGSLPPMSQTCPITARASNRLQSRRTALFAICQARPDLPRI